MCAVGLGALITPFSLRKSKDECLIRDCDFKGNDLVNTSGHAVANRDYDAEFWVDCNANTNGDGTRDRPFDGLKRVSENWPMPSRMTAEVRVHMMRGAYKLEDTQMGFHRCSFVQW